MTFWVVAGTIAVVLLGVWLWADRHQPGRADGNRQGDDAVAQGRTASWMHRNEGSGPRGL
jgi:hypothetical protein